jgi:hypothetical protein
MRVWAFTDDQVADILAVGDDTGHDLGEEVHYALAFDEATHREQYLAVAQPFPSGHLQVAHRLACEMVGELKHVDTVGHDFTQRRRYATLDALVPSVAADANHPVHAPQALRDKPLVQAI